MSPHSSPASNPYQPPGSVDDGVQFIEIPDANSADRIGERTVEALCGTQTWVRMMGWLALLLGCLTALQTIGWARRLGEDGAAMIFPALAALMLGSLYAVGGLLLLRYASRIGDFTISRRVEHLDSALEAQRAFWRFLGISIAAAFILLIGGILVFLWAAGAVGAWQKVFG